MSLKKEAARKLVLLAKYKWILDLLIKMDGKSETMEGDYQKGYKDAIKEISNDLENRIK